MNLRFVEAFYWVATLKSVTRAAEKLFITQSAASSRIAALEEELGALLLDRRGKGLKLTTAGARFLTYAERLLALQTEAKAEMGSGSAQPMSLRMGAIESVLHSWLIDWLRHMRGTTPELELELTVETTPVLVEQLQRGALDLVFTALPAGGQHLRTHALPSMEMVFTGHAEVHRKRSYSLAELAKFDLLTFQRGSQPHVALLDLFRQAGIEVRRVHSISSISAMAQLVENGLGVATLPLPVVERLTQQRPLRALRCPSRLTPLPLHLSYRQDPGASVLRVVVDAVFAYLGGTVEHQKNR